MKNNEYFKMIFLLMKKYKVHFLFVFSLIIALSEFILAIKMDVLISTLSSGKNEKFFFIAGMLVILCIIIGKLKSVLGKKIEIKEKECCQLISDDLIKNIEKIPFRKFEDDGEGGWITLLLSDVSFASFRDCFLCFSYVFWIFYVTCTVFLYTYIMFNINTNSKICR